MTMNIQYYHDEQGHKMFVVPEHVFNGLQSGKGLENYDPTEIADIEICNRIKQRIRDNNEELIPNEVVKRIYKNGENRIRVFRQWRGYKAIELARMIGVSPGHITHLEQGKRDGSITTYQKIAKALNVKINRLLPRIDTE